MGQLLIITNSYDATTDLLIPRLPDCVFRFNVDLIAEYKYHSTRKGLPFRMWLEDASRARTYPKRTGESRSGHQRKPL